MAPYRWGDPAHPVALPAAAVTALGHLGVKAPAGGPVDPSEITLTEPALPPAARSALELVVGADHLDGSAAARVGHTRGYSTPDLLRLRAGDATDAPDLVVYPGSHDEVRSEEHTSELQSR